MSQLPMHDSVAIERRPGSVFGLKALRLLEHRHAAGVGDEAGEGAGLATEAPKGLQRGFAEHDLTE